MDLIALAIALKKAKKYTDDKVKQKTAGVSDVQKDDGTSIVSNGVATLPEDLQGVTDVQVNGTSVVNNGVANFGLIASENGAFGLRYYNGVLQYKNGNNWVTISLASQTI